MKFYFKMFMPTNHTYELNSSVPDSLLSISHIGTAHIKELSKEKDFLIVFSYDTVCISDLIDENGNTPNIIFVPLKSFDDIKSEAEAAKYMWLVHTAKVVACDARVWDSIKEKLNILKKWADLTGASLPLKKTIYNVLDSNYKNINFFGSENSSFLKFLKENNSTKNKNTIVMHDFNELPDVIYPNTLAITTHNHSRLWIDTLASLYPFIMYPHSDYAFITSGVDSRGRCSDLNASIFYDENKIGRSGEVNKKWEQTMFDLNVMLGSLKGFPYIHPTTQNFFDRLFNEINRSL